MELNNEKELEDMLEALKNCAKVRRAGSVDKRGNVSISQVDDDNTSNDDNNSDDTNTDVNDTPTVDAPNQDVNDKEDDTVEDTYLVQTVPVINPNIFDGAFYQGYLDYDSTDMSSIEPFSEYEYYDGKTDGILLFPLAECIIGDRGYDTASTVTIRIYTQNVYTDVENLFLLVSGVEGYVEIFGETEAVYC